MDPRTILNNPLLNKGTAFTQKERDAFGLHGFLPYHISTLAEQVERRYLNFKEKPDDLSKYLFLTALQNRNEVLFYSLVFEHISEMLPLIYTPTVGAASVHHSLLYTQYRGLYLSYPLKDRVEAIVQNYPQNEIDVIVVTDGERILGLGDLGSGGMAIPVGKLALYTLFGGIHPERTLPVMLDVGTNNEALLKDPLYLGWQNKRISGKEYDEFVDIFVRAVKKRYPNVLLQWEDFGRDHAQPLLDRYRNEICSFNDDIQGTAAVVLAAIYAAVKKTQSCLQDQKIVIYGAGSAGVGIANMILGAIKEKVPEEAARLAFYMIDIGGLVHSGQGQVLPQHKLFARSAEEVAAWKVKDKEHISLSDVVQNVRPTVLIGVSTHTGAFTEEIVRTMAKYVEYPAIFPLSNPTSKCEAHPSDLIQWTKGKAIIATGSPFDPVSYQGRTYPIAQCNNVSIFPGIGLGVIAGKARAVTEKMFYKASEILSEHSPLLREPFGGLFPPFETLREISRKIAVAVVLDAMSENLSRLPSNASAEAAVDSAMWSPAYQDLSG